MRVVKVYWLDSASQHGWHDRDGAIEWGKKSDGWIVTVGFVLSDTPSFLTVTGSLSEDQVGSPLKFPKFAIKHTETLIEDEPVPDGKPAVLAKKPKHKTPTEE